MREIRRICRPEGIGDLTLKRKTVAGVFEPIWEMQPNPYDVWQNDGSPCIYTQHQT